jgi:tetratricopeptide (TPR) repeat protein
VEKTEVEAAEQRALELQESGNETAALEIWLRLAHARPTAGFYCQAGSALQTLGRFAEAESAFRSALELDPNLTLAPIGLASTLIDEGKFAEAINVLEATVREESALVYELRGVALMNLNQDHEALQSFRRAVELDPSYDEAFYNIGRLLRNTDEAAARSAFTRAIELDNTYAGAHRELGWILRKANELDLAERHLRPATELNAGDAWAWVYLGNLLWAKGKFSAGEEAFKHAEAQAPREWYPNWALATFYEDREDPRTAARFYDKALLASPSEPVLLFHYGRFLSRQGDREGAEKYLRRACEIEPGYDKPRELLREVTGAG